ncbi:SRPBCC family protein [Mycobacterium sp.]|uniref:SRPBCC family protein n=1 Tax=Mycobacterium sp. TaxID=1785 RepID=UPI0025D9F99F|nr:SRPBCC family protein [Mycobacterium sp.]
MTIADFNLDGLIEDSRVHGSLYTDPQIYAEELRRIWYRGWVFVGHDSEIPAPGDAIRRAIAHRPVTLLRRSDGTVDIDGVARADSIHGFVFGSFAADGPGLDEHLGDATAVFDQIARLSPTGKVRLDCGWLEHEVNANWKLLVENEVDGYHPTFVHGSIFSVARGPLTGLFDGRSVAGARALDQGHTELVVAPQFRQAGPLSWVSATPAQMPEYMQRMHDAYGERADEYILEGPPHAMIFPNLFIAEIQVFVIAPCAVDRTVQLVTALQLDDAAELNSKLFRNTMGSVGPAGLLLADDAEMYERNQRGVTARHPEWLDLSRGLGREYRDADGHLAGHVTDEVTQRAIWRHYRQVMA